MVNAHDILRYVADIYGITVDDMVSKLRYRRYADARAVACYVLCSLNFYTFSEVGRLLHKSHATVMYHNSRASDWLRSTRLNPRGVAAIKEVEKKSGLLNISGIMNK